MPGEDWPPDKALTRSGLLPKEEPSRVQLQRRRTSDGIRNEKWLDNRLGLESYMHYILLFKGSV